ncbi:anosmin-1-like isoform X2 [Asterias rubens]|uniref:anosmin-1-like isoform X2 n=1 Tax=Asterias rubens TaxID=7604 RepID=UPI001455AE07|nr:anosmin-1-like isoform X2 [Asterias rubens]
MLCTQQCEWEDRRFWGQTPVNIMNFCRFVSVQKRKMLRLKWLAVLGVLLGTIRITHGSILEAQCRARCYSSASLHVSTTEESRGESYRLLCLNSTNCSSCVIPCSSEYKTSSLCKSKCVLSSDISWCHSSCEYLKLSHNQKTGTCPPLDTIQGFGKACAETCSNDSQCNRKEKCCYNGCGYTCQEPIVNRLELPPKTRNSPTVTENLEDSSITLEWQLRGSQDASGVILYVVQGRNNSGRHPSTRNMDVWTDLAITEKRSYEVDVTLGKYYTFQIASVNENGSMGFCQPSTPFRLSRDPQSPSSPINLREGQSTATFDHKIDVKILWDPPKSSDLQITRYRVFFVEWPSSVMHYLFEVTEYSINIPGSQHSVTIPSLRPDMRYKIQVQAISLWGDARMRSERTEILIRTIGGLADSPHVPKPIDPLPAPGEAGEIPGEPREVTPEDPYWESGVLKCRISWKKPKGFEETVNLFMVHWQPMGCAQDYENSTKSATTHSRHFDIYNLMFDCQYRVELVAVSDTRLRSNGTSIRFYTPACNALKVKGRVKPVCPTPVPDIPSEPQNVSYVFLLANTNITARFRWAPPAVSLYDIIGYRVVWAEHAQISDTLFGEGFPLLLMSKAESIILPARKKSYDIENLKTGTRYGVQIQALTNRSGGAVAYEDLKTPRIQPGPPQNFVPTSTVVTELMGRISTQSNVVQTDQEGHSGTRSWHETSKWTLSLVLFLSCLMHLLILR